MKKINLSTLEKILKRHPVITSAKDLKKYKAYSLKRIINIVKENCIAIKTNAGCLKNLVVKDHILIYIEEKDGKYYFDDIL